MTRLKQGDIVMLALDPAVGSEIKETRPALILTNSEFQRNGRALIAPITQGGNIDRVAGWAVTLMGSGTKTQGAAVVSQCRTVDLKARGASYVESVSAAVIDDAMARLQAALDPE